MAFSEGYGIGSLKPGVCTSTTRPGSPFIGQTIFETDTTLAKVWNGSAWVEYPPGKANTASPTFTGTVTIPAGASISGYAPTASPTFTGTVALPTTVASGVLTATAQPSFLATRSGNLTGYTGGNTVVFNTTSYNIGSHYNTSTGLFTAPVAGNYVFSASIYQSAFVSQVWFRYNGARERTFAFDGGNTWNILAGASNIYLNVGDTLGVASWSDGQGRTIYQQYEHTFFRGALIS
jgi:hypothetical protein